MIKKKLEKMGIDVNISRGLKALLKCKEDFTKDEREEITKLLYEVYIEKQSFNKERPKRTTHKTFFSSYREVEDFLTNIL